MTWATFLSKGPAVTFMLERIRKETGVEVSPSEHILCLPCDKTRSGGFTPELGAVLLCQGNFWSKKHMEHTLTHELVHMYDHYKFDVDWGNLRHHACSEVSLIGVFILYDSVQRIDYLAVRLFNIRGFQFKGSAIDDYAD